MPIRGMGTTFYVINNVGTDPRISPHTYARSGERALHTARALPSVMPECIYRASMTLYLRLEYLGYPPP